MSSSSAQPLMLTCPTCQRRFAMQASPTLPFCCERCQLIDLGQWLREERGLPYDGSADALPDDDET